MGGVSKADGRRHSRHAAKYTRQAARVLKRKTANVARASHGKFTREALMEHQAGIEGKRKAKPVVHKRKPEIGDREWLSTVPLQGAQREFRREAW